MFSLDFDEMFSEFCDVLKETVKLHSVITEICTNLRINFFYRAEKNRTITKPAPPPNHKYRSDSAIIHFCSRLKHEEYSAYRLPCWFLFFLFDARLATQLAATCEDRKISEGR